MQNIYVLHTIYALRNIHRYQFSSAMRHSSRTFGYNYGYARFVGKYTINAFRSKLRAR